MVYSSIPVCVYIYIYIYSHGSFTLFNHSHRLWQSISIKIINQNSKQACIITSSCYRTNTGSLYQNIKVLKVPEIYDYAIGVFMYKLHHGLIPSIFQCMFAVNSATHDYGTRQKDHYKVPKVKLEVVKIQYATEVLSYAWSPEI